MNLFPLSSHDRIRMKAFLQSAFGSQASQANAMVNPMTAVGDLIVGGTPDDVGIPSPTPLAVGSAGQVLAVVDGTPQWATLELVIDGGHS